MADPLTSDIVPPFAPGDPSGPADAPEAPAAADKTAPANAAPAAVTAAVEAADTVGTAVINLSAAAKADGGVVRMLKDEPVAVVGSIVAAYHAVVAYLLIAGIVHASANAVVSLEAAIVAILSVPVTLLVRQHVTPVAKL